MISNCLLVNLTLSCPSGIRKSKEATNTVCYEYHCSTKSVHTSKKIWGDALDDIKKLQAQIRAYHVLHTQPWMDSGFRIIPQKHITKYYEKMREFRGQLEGLVSTACSRVDTIKNEARTQLGGLYKESDYAPDEDLSKIIGIKVDTMKVPEFNDFRLEVSDSEAQYIKDQLMNSAEKAVQESMRAAWDKLRGAIQRVSTGCSEEGRVSKGMMGTLQDVLNSLKGFNLTNDTEIDNIIDKAQQELSDYTSDDIKSNGDTREAVKRKADAILAKIKNVCI